MKPSIINSEKTLAKKLKDLFEVRNILIATDSIDQTINQAIQIALKKLNSQTAAVFLFSKGGILERIALNGVDKNGNPIDDDWYSNEAYSSGESFTGKVVMPRSNSTFGEPNWSNNLDSVVINDISRNKYLEKLGKLNCAIAVPLNGQNKSFGVLEVINKLNKKGSEARNLCFTQDDVYWLSNISMTLANSISSFRRKNELTFLFDISQKLVEPFSSKINPEGVYNEIASRLVGPLLSYNACIIRLEDQNEVLRTVARAGDQVEWNDRFDTDIKKGERLPGAVYKGGKIIKYSNIEEHKDEFNNYDWIRNNRIKSYICLPLSTQEKTIGTLSLFTGYSQEFSDSDIEFLKHISNLVATFHKSVRVIDELNKARQNLLVQSDKLQSSSKGVIYNLPVESLLHTHKHDLEAIQEELQEALSKSPGRRLVMLKKQIVELKKQTKEIRERMDSSSEQRLQKPVDINAVIKEVASFFKLQLDQTDENITIKCDLSIDIPLISAIDDEIREVVFNLLSNAIKAIQAAEKKQGQILITTKIENLDYEYITIIIEDNGIGIRNEDADKIYDRSFTKFVGGTGAGLTITRYIVENTYAGKIFFESKVGNGTKFFVRIPKQRLQID